MGAYCDCNHYWLLLLSSVEKAGKLAYSSAHPGTGVFRRGFYAALALDLCPLCK